MIAAPAVCPDALIIFRISVELSRRLTMRQTRTTTNAASGPIDVALNSYQRTKAWLLDYIAEQRLGPGDRIPSERTLADALGLSRPTVARAVSELVKEGVLAREERVGTYVGAYSSRRLGARVGTIGIVMPWLSQDPSGAVTGLVEPDKPFYPFRREHMSFYILQGMMPVLNEAGFRLVVRSNARLSEEMDVLRSLPNEGLDGAIILPAPYGDNARLFVELAKTGLPVVLVDHYFPDCPLDRVVTDNLTGARQAVEYLIEKGHRRIAHFTNFEDITSALDRELGYRVALGNAGIPYDEDIVCGPQISAHKQWSFQFALEHCLSLPDPITAVFCLNEPVLLETLQAANRMGIRVPSGLTVAGFFDDSIPPGLEVPFTRVVQGKAEMGRAAATLLLERVAGTAPRAPRHILVPAELVPSVLV